MSSAGVSARAPSAPLASYLASDPKLITAPRSNWSADLVLLVALLGLTALLGRPFSKVGVGEFDIYITEPLLLLTGFFALRRCGFRGALERLRRVIPLWPLLLLWLAGAIATARGLYLFGFKMVTYDVGLVEYSIMLALVPVVIDTRQRAISLLKVVFWAGLGAGLIYIGQRFVDHESVNNPGYALGIYIAIFVLGVAAWAAHRLQVRWYLYGLALIAMTAMSWLGVRAVWVALFAAIVTVAVLAPRGHRFVTAAVLAAAFVLSNLGSYGLTELQARVNPPPPPPGAVMVGPAADPDFIADDSGSSVLGGETVQGDAAQGKLSREVRRGYYLDLPVLRSLESDKPYTVLFSVKPLDPVPALGRVGDTSGAGWGAQTWRARPEVRWQAFKKVFEPTDSDERLVLSFDEGPARVRFDGIKVIKGIVKEPASDYQSPTPPCSCAATEAVREARREGKGETEEVIDTSLTKPNIISEARGTFDPNVAGPSYNNTEWRFAIWKFELERAAQQPDRKRHV